MHLLKDKNNPFTYTQEQVEYKRYADKKSERH